MPKPKSVTLTMTCPYCREETELPLNKKEIKKLLKTFKLSAKKNILMLKFKCCRCQKEIQLEVRKNELKAIYEGFRKPTITQAEEHAFKHIKY
jgi:DNA-directed RNA polymerase subunit RPC12/RpoP